MGQYGSYEKHVIDAAVGDAALAAAIVLEAAPGAILTKTVNEPITVTRFGFRPTVAFDYDSVTPTIGVLTIYRYPVANGTGKVPLATISLQDGALVDNVYYVDVPNPAVPPVKNEYGVVTTPGRNKADIDAGEAVVIEITTQAAGGTEDGDFQPFFCYHPRAEVAANQTKMHNLTPAQDIPGVE